MPSCERETLFESLRREMESWLVEQGYSDLDAEQIVAGLVENARAEHRHGPGACSRV